MSRRALLLTALLAGCGDASPSTNDLGPDGAGPPADLATSDRPAADAAPPGSVGPTGGTVDRLYFAFHGDTRGPNCDDPTTYPTAIIRNIYSREAALGVQFAADLGDHMNACGTVAGEPQIEMGLYTDAAQLLGAPTFMTMGNHECSTNGICTASDPNTAALLAALKPISTLPYYSVDVQTRTGLATFVFIADNAWDDTEQAWLEATLTQADARAKYTLLFRHHPIDYTKLQAPLEWQIIQQHKRSLLFVSHSHQYLRDTANDPSGRTVIMGCGGAPLEKNQPWFGFGTVEQGQDDRLTVTVYDEASGLAQDAWTVDPQ